MSKSYIAQYLKIWILWLLFMLSVRFLLLLLIGKKSDEAWDNPFAIYLTGSWILAVVLHYTEARRLMNYLKENHNDKWKELTYVPGLGFGKINSFNSVPFLFSKENYSDPMVDELKNNYKKALLVLFSGPQITDHS